MDIGKIHQTVLKRSVYKQIRKRRKDILTKPGIGQDFCAVQSGPDELAVITTNPVSGSCAQIARMAVHQAVNNLVCSGARPAAVTLAVMLPDGARESDLREMMQEIEAQCVLQEIEVTGGHTEVMTAINQPVVCVTGIGHVAADKLLSVKRIKAGQDIVMTKWAGMRGTWMMAEAYQQELLSHYNQGFIQEAVDLSRYISVRPEAELAAGLGATALHDVSSGGVYAALWDIAAGSNMGLEVDLKKIPIRQETVEICEFFDLNPYMLSSNGSLLIVCDQGEHLSTQLRAEGIEACVIGRMKKGNDRIIVNDDEVRYLEPPKPDEIYKMKELKGKNL